MLGFVGKSGGKSTTLCFFSASKQQSSGRLGCQLGVCHCVLATRARTAALGAKRDLQNNGSGHVVRSPQKMSNKSGISKV